MGLPFSSPGGQRYPAERRPCRTLNYTLGRPEPVVSDGTRLHDTAPTTGGCGTICAVTAWKPQRQWMGPGQPVATDRLIRCAFDLLSAAVVTSHLEYQLALADSPSANEALGHSKSDAFEVTVAHEWARLINTHSAFDGHVARREVKYRRADTGEVVRADLVLEKKDDNDRTSPVIVAELKVGKDRNWTNAQLEGDAVKLENLCLDSPAREAVGGRKFVTVVVTPAKQLTGLANLRQLALHPSLQWPDIPPRAPRTQQLRAGWEPRILALFPRYTPAPSAPSSWGRHEWTVSAIIAYEHHA